MNDWAVDPLKRIAKRFRDACPLQRIVNCQNVHLHRTCKSNGPPKKRRQSGMFFGSEARQAKMLHLPIYCGTLEALPQALSERNK